MSTQYERKIILVGKTGNGKSSLGNVLLGRQAFSQACGFSAVTKKCQLERKEEYISVVDTPGLFDSDKNKSLYENALEILRAVQLCPKPHAFLIVLNGSTRLTEEELLIIDVLRIIFGEQCLKKAIIVFTHTENDLDPKELNRKIKDCNEMSSLIEQCGGRFARIDNKDPMPEHKEDIIRLVDTVSTSGTDSFQNVYMYVHRQVLEESLTGLDSRPLHAKIKQLSERICEDVEKEMERILKYISLACGGVCVTAATVVCLKKPEVGILFVNVLQNPEVVKTLAKIASSEICVTKCVPNVLLNNPKVVERLGIIARYLHQFSSS